MPNHRSDPKTERITFVLPRDLRLAAERTADERDLSVAQLCRRGLRLALDIREVVTLSDDKSDARSNPFLSREAKAMVVTQNERGKAP